MSDSKTALISPSQWVIAFVVVVVVGALVAGWFLLPIDEGSAAFQAWIKGLGAWGWFIFAAVYIVGTVLLVPGSVLTFAGGLIFGLKIGFALVVVSATIGATLAFLVARYLVHEKVGSLICERPKLKAIRSAVSEGGWKVVALLRLSPVVPFNLQNYFYGITHLKLLEYVPATFIGIMPGTLLNVYLGAAGKAVIGGNAGAGIDGGGGAGAGDSMLQWGFFAIGLVATVVVGVFVTKKAKAKLKEHGVGNGKGDGADTGTGTGTGTGNRTSTRKSTGNPPRPPERTDG